ncbi:extracellular solute-binding protein [Bacillus sp. ISL-47]|uniref:extracellular solute-binding protein n=1 Tax=Bacillus sp. ISL-47 TaxID=2819130 RepID=UPI001BE6097D|nr:extracellular solute-binding protein [Bacillus sp. ISL-47]MBT2688995.1 extracellular solute-binding protein [Bacillus sp. ISL-47]MBT2708726.1 extracellular solute-binding protein [Pseudomonas sp. ISL-84]
MKRALSLFMMIVLVFGVLAACGPKDEEETGSNDSKTEGEQAKPEKLIVWEDTDKGTALKDAAQKFEAEHGIKIEFKELNITKMQENLALDGNTENAPDVVTMSHDGVGPAMVKGYIKELEVDSKILGQFTDSSVDALKYEGKLYGLPKATETPVFIYNKDLLPEVPATMEDLYTKSKEVTKDGNYGFLAIWDDFYHAHGIFSGFGGYVFGEKDSKPDVTDIGLNNDSAVEAAEYINKWYAEGLFPKGIIGEKSNDNMNGLFKEGKAIAVQNGPWAFKDYSDAGVNYGVAAMPKLPNGEPVKTFMGVKGWFVTNFSKNPDWSQKFVEYITNEENAKKRFELTGEIPPLKSLMEDPEFVQNNEGAAAVMEQSQYAVPMPSVPEMAEVWDPMKKAVETIVTGKSEAKPALDNAVKTIEQQIEANHSGN